jgi:hypothetical protein
MKSKLLKKKNYGINQSREGRRPAGKHQRLVLAMEGAWEPTQSRQAGG